MTASAGAGEEFVVSKAFEATTMSDGRFATALVGEQSAYPCRGPKTAMSAVAVGRENI
jgi:hypothetical protein